MKIPFLLSLVARSLLMMIVFAATIYSQAIPPDPATIAPVIHPPNPHTNIVLSLADFLVDNNGHRRSPYQAFKLAIEACRQQNAARLIIPTGVYAFNDPQILQDGAHIGLYSLSDLTIDGQGSEFIFHFAKLGVAIDGCQRLLIRNLTIDYDLPLASLGTAKKETNGTTTIHFLNSYPVAAGTPFQLIAPYDISNLKWRKACCEIYSPRNVTMVAPQIFTSPDFASLQDGEEVVVQHYRYEGNAFEAVSYLVSDISFENITIYGCPGMGFYVSSKRGFRLSHCTIRQKPGAQRPVSAAADGAHFTNTSGDILVEDCDFSGQGDDSLNIAGPWVPVTAKVNSRNVMLTRQYSSDLIRRGDQLKFVKPNNLAEYARRNVTQVSYNPSNGQFAVTVDQDLPVNLAVGDLAINLTHTNPRFLVRHNHFHDHRGRGMLIQSWSGVIEDNVVQNPTWQGINLFTDGAGFFEGPGPNNVIVRNNTFEGCSYGNYGTAGSTMGALNITADVPGGISAYPVDRNILVDGNIIFDTPGLAIFISSASGITVSNNVVINSNTLGDFPPWYGSAIGVVAHGSIMAAKASHALLTDNLEVNRYQQPERGIHFDPGTTTACSVQNNSQASPTAGGTLALHAPYVSGSPVTLLATPHPGGSFVGWTEGGRIVSTSASFSFSLQANRNLLANFTLSATGPPVVTTNPATFVASFSAKLNGSLDPRGLTTTVYFQYGTTTSYGLTTAPQSQTGNTFRDITANVSGLSASTTYHFRIVATNSAGTVYGADRTFTMLSATGPPVVTTNPATNVTTSSATLNGSLDPHSLTTTVHFQYGTTTSYTHATAMVTQTGNTYRNIASNIGGLTMHTTYHFRIVGTNSGGTRVGGDRTFTTP